MEFKREGRLWLPDRPRFIASRKQSLLAVTNLSGFGGGGGGPPILTLLDAVGFAGSSGTVVSNSVNIPSGALVIVVVTTPDARTLSSVSDGTNTYTVDDNGTGNPCAAIASCPNAAAVTGSVTATLSAAAINRQINVYVIANAALTSPLDKKASATGTSTAPTATTAATTLNNTVVIGVVQCTGASTITEDANFTNDATGFATTRMNIAHKTINPTTTGAQTYAPTLGSSVTWRCLVAAYKGLS